MRKIDLAAINGCQKVCQLLQGDFHGGAATIVTLVACDMRFALFRVRRYARQAVNDQISLPSDMVNPFHQICQFGRQRFVIAEPGFQIVSERDYPFVEAAANLPQATVVRRLQGLSQGILQPTPDEHQTSEVLSQLLEG